MASKEVKKELTNVSREKILNQISEIGHTLYGMEPIIKIYCLSKASDLTIMLLGAHATAKSSLARMWSLTTGLNYRVVTSCFDGQTEVLTKRGWKYFKDLRYSDSLLTLNLLTKEMEYQLPSNLIADNYEGKMLQMKSRWIDLLVTPEHRMVLHTKPFGRSRDLVLKAVKDTYLQTKQFTKTGNWKGSEPEYLDFPKTTYLKRSKGISEVSRVRVEPFLKFLGYYLAEGSYDSHKRDSKLGGYFYRVTLDLYNKKYSLDCAEALKNMGFNPTISENGNVVLCYAKQLYDYCKQFGHAKEKFIPEDVKTLNPRLLKILWESWNRGDGHKVRGHWKVGTTVSRKLVDDLQEIALKIGISAKIAVQEPSFSFIKGRRIRSSITYRLLISHRNLQPRACWNRGYGSSYNEEWISYKGKVYCAQVPNHTLYVRRNGIPIWSGNSEVDESLIAYIDPAIFREKNIVQMRRGELMEKDHIIVDEFFLWLNKYRAKLHQLLEERTYAGLDVLTKTYTFLSNPLSDYYAGQIEEKNLACYSEDTEILTNKGWKKYTEISNDEKVFTLNPKTQEISLEQIRKKVIYPYNGKMYELDTQQVNQLVTPNHRMYIAKQEKGKWIWQVKEARELYGQKFRLLKNGNWEGVARVSKDYMSLIGWYLAEGSPKTFRDGHYGIDLSVCTPKYIDEVMTLARKLGYNPHLQKDGHIVIWNKELWKVCKPLGHADSKYIPENLKTESKENLRSLLFAYLKGDGWNQNGEWLAKTVSKRLADDVQEISLKAGYSVNLVNIGKSSGYSKKLGRTITSKFDCWQISLITSRNRPLILGRDNKNRLRTREEWKDYFGKVWCVSTSNGILYVRRKGKPCWSGNTIDRLDLFVPVNQPKIVPSESMMRKFSEFGRSERTLKKVISWEDYLQAKEEISKVEVPSRIVIWLSLFAHSMAACKHTEDKFSMSIPKLKKLCAGCNENNHICAKVALSKPRFLRATIILAKGLAWLSGRKTISFKDINEAVIYTLPHRLSWIQEELSYAESLEMVPELVQQFNDEMLAWKNRGIFSELSTVIEASKKKPPVFDDKTSSSLTADVSEIHLLKEFVAETIQSVKEGICRYYSEGGESTKFSSLGKLEEYVEHSNLNPYEKDDLIFSIARKQKELCIQFAYSSDKVEKLIQAVIVLHKSFNVEVDSKEILMKRFSEAILYCSELVKIREESGEIQIIFKDPDTKKMFLNLWEEEI
jgi:hypothetical protein